MIFKTKIENFIALTKIPYFVTFLVYKNYFFNKKEKTEIFISLFTILSIIS